MIVKFETLSDGPASGTILRGVEVQPVPTPVIATIGINTSTKDLVLLVDQEYRDQQLTPAMRELLRRCANLRFASML